MEDNSASLKYQILNRNYEQFKHPRTGLPVRLFRIIALKDFESPGGFVKAGETGGFVQSEANLSQTDSTWIAQTAKVFDNVCPVDSYITNDARIFDSPTIENSIISGKARVFGECIVKGSLITDNGDVLDKAKVSDSKVKNASVVCGNGVSINSELNHGSRISGNAKVIDSKMFDASEAKSQAIVENCHLGGRAVVSGTLKNESRTEQIELNVTVGLD